VHSIEPRIDLGNVNADLRDRTLERAEAQALFVLLLAHQTDLGEYAAALLGDEFEADSLIAHQPPYKPEKGSSQSRHTCWVQSGGVASAPSNPRGYREAVEIEGRAEVGARRRLFGLERDPGRVRDAVDRVEEADHPGRIDKSCCTQRLLQRAARPDQRNAIVAENGFGKGSE